ncbi:MAG: flagellin [Burkholderiales bacterium]
MPMVINTNVASISTQRNLYKTSDMLNQSIQRLSSGKRINSAKDDAAGLAISERMTTQIRGLDQAVRNANDAISLAQTAEGALGTITENLQRIRELALQSANDVNSASDRVALNQESTQLLQEIERTATQTSYNGRTLLDGTFTAQQFQIGAEANQTVAVTLGNSRLANLGVNTVSTVSVGAAAIDQSVAVAAALPAANGLAAQTLTVQGSTGTGTAILAAGQTAQSVAQAVNVASNTTGVTATARTIATLNGLVNAGVLAFDLHGSNSAVAKAVRVTASVTSTLNLQSVADAINLKSSQTGITAAVNGGTNVVLTSNDGYDIGVANFANTSVAGNQGFGFSGQGGTVVTLTEGTNDSSKVGGRVTFNSADGFTVATSAGTTLFNNATGLTGVLSALSTMDISTSANSNSAISIIDGALQQINSQRAGLGATQKRVTQTISNLQNISENMNAARSRMVDTDFAAETSALTRAQILQQAGTAMLAQANAAPNQVMSLLRG